MPSNKTVSHPDYWNELYLAGDTGWDKGAAAPPIVRLLEEGVAGLGPVAVLGAGPGHEAIAAARAGLRVTAIDFAPEAITAMRARAIAASVELELLQEDLFALPALRPGAFSAVLEHTCFCAIEVARRSEYVEAVHRLLAPRGVLFGLFYSRGREGPPYATSEAEVRELFAPRFQIERLHIPPDSFPARAGHELEFLFRKLPEASP